MSSLARTLLTITVMAKRIENNSRMFFTPHLRTLLSALLRERTHGFLLSSNISVPNGAPSLATGALPQKSDCLRIHRLEVAMRLAAHQCGKACLTERISSKWFPRLCLSWRRSLESIFTTSRKGEPFRTGARQSRFSTFEAKLATG